MLVVGAGGTWRMRDIESVLRIWRGFARGLRELPVWFRRLRSAVFSMETSWIRVLRYHGYEGRHDLATSFWAIRQSDGQQNTALRARFRFHVQHQRQRANPVLAHIQPPESFFFHSRRTRNRGGREMMVAPGQ